MCVMYVMIGQWFIYLNVVQFVEVFKYANSKSNYLESTNDQESFMVVEGDFRAGHVQEGFCDLF